MLQSIVDIRRSRPAARRGRRAPAPRARARARSSTSRIQSADSEPALRPARIEPAAAAALLRIGGRGIHLEPPGPRRLGAEGHLEPQQLLAPRHEQRHLAAGLNVDDEIIAIDDYRVRADRLDNRLDKYRPGDKVTLLV